MPKFGDLIEEYRAKVLEKFGRSFYHDPIILVILTIFSVMLLGLLLLLILKVQPSSADVPLTYNVVYGVTYSSSWFGPYFYLLSIISFGIVNFLIAWAYFNKERLLSYLIAFINLLLATLTIVSVYNLIVLAK